MLGEHRFHKTLPLSKDFGIGVIGYTIRTI